MMYYLDSQRTITRRDSSLIVSKARHGGDLDGSIYTARDRDSSSIQTEDFDGRHRNFNRSCHPVRKEIVTVFFESMLPHIIDNWQTIPPPENYDIVEEELKICTYHKHPKKKSFSGIRSKRKKSEFSEEQQLPLPLAPQSWWTGQDERAIITFRNGNRYEGSISMKVMEGPGRFQWSNGTIYLGHFKNNAIRGRGTIQWKDESWFEGQFLNNVRHGTGLYVDTRRGRYYMGDWDLGTKHGQGFIQYSPSNSYDGWWHHNIRSGFGNREYTSESVYKGEWDSNVIEGKGLMIWPNHDFYRGEWRNAKMHGYGIYMWDMYYNNSMSHPTIATYRGYWENGMRHGFGCLNLGFWLGAYYKGGFQLNKKHGHGKLVANNGSIIQSHQLFDEDNMAELCSEQNVETHQFEICGDVDLLYHIAEAYQNIDKNIENRSDIINDFYLYNKFVWMPEKLTHRKPEYNTVNICEFVKFEEKSLRNALQCYATELREIYNQYATICNTEKTHFAPILIRLYLWQLFYDCDIHKKGLTLLDIDKLLYQNPDWLSNSLHNAFEKVYYWQFLHCLIAVTRKLYCSRQMPGPKPETLLATAFRKFMIDDLIPGAGLRKGKLVQGYARIIPLKPLYRLYRSIGEPHTIRQFINEVYQSPQILEPAPEEVEIPSCKLPNGYNAYVLGDEIDFIPFYKFPTSCINEIDPINPQSSNLKLFNFGNIPCKTIIRIFGDIFPQVLDKDIILNLEVRLTFFEFFEAFILCAEESIRIKEQESEQLHKDSSDIHQFHI